MNTHRTYSLAALPFICGMGTLLFVANMLVWALLVVPAFAR